MKKLILAFMGYTFNEKTQEYYIPRFNSGDWYAIHDIDFTSSWDFLMPVVFKITELKGVHKQEQQKVFNSICSEITITHKACVEFIEWYNENQSN